MREQIVTCSCGNTFYKGDENLIQGSVIGFIFSYTYCRLNKDCHKKALELSINSYEEAYTYEEIDKKFDIQCLSCGKFGNKYNTIEPEYICSCGAGCREEEGEAMLIDTLDSKSYKAHRLKEDTK